MESMSQAPLPAAGRALRLSHGRREGARRDGPRRADQPVLRQADVRRGDRGRRRAGDDARRPRPLGAALARARAEGDRRGQARRRDRLGDRKGQKGDTVVEIDEAPRRGSTLEALAKLPGLVGKEGSHTAGNSPGVNDAGGALVLSSEEWATANGKEALAEIVAHAQSANDFAYLATTPAQRREEGAGEGRPEGRGHRPVGDQRGVRLGHAELDPDARDRRGPRERQRRRDRARPPDRRLRRADPRLRSSTSCAAAAAAWAARRSAPAAGRATP